MLALHTSDLQHLLKQNSSINNNNNKIESQRQLTSANSANQLFLNDSLFTMETSSATTSSSSNNTLTILQNHNQQTILKQTPTSSNHLHHQQLMNNNNNNSINYNCNSRAIGIIFVQETLTNNNCYNNNNNNDISSNEIRIGLLLLSNYDNCKYVNQLRNIIKNESIYNLDDSYVFLTSYNFTIQLEQESQIFIDELITVNKTIRFKRRITPGKYSLIGYFNTNDNNNRSIPISIDYIQANHHINLKLLRKIIDEKLNKLKSIDNYYRLASTNYYFRKNLDYILNPILEPNHCLIDICVGMNIIIEFERNRLFFENLTTTTTTSTATAAITMPLDNNRMMMIDGFNSNNNNNNYNSYYNSSNSRRMISGRPDSILIRNDRKKLSRRKTSRKRKERQIMISYVRREAAEHAVSLKISLLKCGFSVYLDVDEILLGADWQDSINAAVQNCDFFIPLITENYGQTQWTNREIKLADMKGKHIIPVNFLDLWPPECLAIQFATTQYISWNPQSSDSLINVTKSIQERINKLLIENSKIINENEFMKSSQNELNTCPNDNFQNDNQQNQTRQNENKQNNQQQQTESKNLIVISAHPKQKEEANKIKELLSEKYNIWCSNDFKNTYNDYNSNRMSNFNSNLRNNSDLSTIDEVNQSQPNSQHQTYSSTAITRPTQDYARHIAENSKQRPKSVPVNEGQWNLNNNNNISNNNSNHLNSNLSNQNNANTNNTKKKELTRVFSCGESTHLSSFSQDKLDHLQCFRKKVIQSSLVIILTSEDYFKSKTSEEHVYYCGLRINTIHVQCDDVTPPHWFTKLTNHEHPLKCNSKNFKEELMGRIARILDPNCKEITYLNDQKIKCLADMMKENMPEQETCVFVFGSTNTENLDSRTNQICEEIGKQLAKTVNNINIITNGTYGAGDIVAHTFYQERLKYSSTTGSVFHIVNSEKYNDDNINTQSKKVSYGKTIFLGQTKKERDSVIARMFDTALLIGGDNDVTREIAEFIWNDHFVIPIRSTGGAAGGQEFDVPKKMFTCPIGVDEKLWSVLSEKDASPKEVAKAVVDIISQLKKAIYEHTINGQHDMNNDSNSVTDMSNMTKNSNNNNKTKQIKKRLANRKRLVNNSISSNRNNSTNSNKNNNNNIVNQQQQQQSYQFNTFFNNFDRLSQTTSTMERRSLPIWSRSNTSDNSSNSSQSDSGDVLFSSINNNNNNNSLHSSLNNNFNVSKNNGCNNHGLRKLMKPFRNFFSKHRT